jgi:hypothetical protein
MIPASYVFLPFHRTPRMSLRPLRRYLLPPTDVCHWLHHGYICRWAGADLPLQRIIRPAVPLPPLPNRFLYRYGGTGYAYTRAELLAALRAPAELLRGVHVNKATFWEQDRWMIVASGLTAFGFRKETIGALAQFWPVGGRVLALSYPANLLPPLGCTLEGFLANLWDALPQQAFIWRWRHPSHYSREPAIFLHIPSTLRWWNGTECQRKMIWRTLYREFPLSHRRVGERRYATHRVAGPLFTAVMPEEFLDDWWPKARAGGDLGPSRTRPCWAAVAR